MEHDARIVVGMLIMFYLQLSICRELITKTKCAFGSSLKREPILPFNLLLLLIIGSFAFFGIIQGSHCTILANFYLYLQYFQQKIFIFSK